MGHAGAKNIVAILDGFQRITIGFPAFRNTMQNKAIIPCKAKKSFSGQSKQKRSHQKDAMVTTTASIDVNGATLPLPSRADRLNV